MRCVTAGLAGGEHDDGAAAARDEIRKPGAASGEGSGDAVDPAMDLPWEAVDPAGDPAGGGSCLDPAWLVLLSLVSFVFRSGWSSRALIFDILDL